MHTLFRFSTNFFNEASKFKYCKAACTEEAGFLISGQGGRKNSKNNLIFKFKFLTEKMHTLFRFSTDCLQCGLKFMYCNATCTDETEFFIFFSWGPSKPEKYPIFHVFDNKKCINFFASQLIFFNEASKLVYCKFVCTNEARVLMN